MVKPGASLVVPALGPPGVAAAATQFGMKPRVRSGYALKRLDASEGTKRWVLKDLNRNTFLRLSDNDAHLFELLGLRTAVQASDVLRRFAAVTGLTDVDDWLDQFRVSGMVDTLLARLGLR